MSDDEKIEEIEGEYPKQTERFSLYSDLVLTEEESKRRAAEIHDLVEEPDGPGTVTSSVPLHDFLQGYGLLKLEERFNETDVSMDTLEQMGDAKSGDEKELFDAICGIVGLNALEKVNLKIALGKHKREQFQRRKRETKIKLEFKSEREIYVIQKRVAATFQKVDVVDVNIAVIGSSEVGKSSVIHRLDTDHFAAERRKTFTEEMYTVYLDVSPSSKSYPTVRAKLWDTREMEKYDSIPPSFFRNKDAVIFAYDITNPKSFDEIEEKWYPQIDTVLDLRNIVLVLAGLKQDLTEGITARTREHVSKTRAQALADGLRMPHVHCSAKTGYNVVELFVEASKLAVERKLEPASGRKKKPMESAASGSAIDIVHFPVPGVVPDAVPGAAAAVAMPNADSADDSDEDYALEGVPNANVDLAARNRNPPAEDGSDGCCNLM